MITCPECFRKVSDQAISCPNCGKPISSKKENKGHFNLKSILLGAALAIFYNVLSSMIEEIPRVISLKDIITFNNTCYDGKWVGSYASDRPFLLTLHTEGNKVKGSMTVTLGTKTSDPQEKYSLHGEIEGREIKIKATNINSSNSYIAITGTYQSHEKKVDISGICEVDGYTHSCSSNKWNY